VVTGQGADLTRPAAASEDATVLEIDMPHGPARAHVHRGADPSLAVVLGHGAGGGIGARDLQAAATAALAEGASVALVEQPYRVAGRRSPAPARQLDAAWIAVIERLLDSELRGLPLIAGGRSSGARVACRTAEATGAVGVLCLAFPFQPPRRSGGAPPATRQSELDLVKVPMLIVQGENDPFGMPPGGRRRKVVTVRGDHSLRSDLESVQASVGRWIGRLAARVRS
jgi:predicted alpha/beta-hydrolase family hydrolase